MRDRTKRAMTGLAVVGSTALVLVGLLWLGQRRLIYLPDGLVGDPPGDVSVIETETSDGILHRLWLVPAEGEPVARVIVYNGNAGNKSHRVPLARDLAAEGMEVVLFDYRGYGDTDGSPSEEGLLLDAEAVAEAIGNTGLPIVYLGESLGSGPAVALAARRPPAALALRSPFTSLSDMARTHYPFVPAHLLLKDRFDVEETIAAVEVPVLVILGTRDSIVPPDLSRRVFEAANPPKDLVELEGLSHNDPGLTSGPELAAAIRRFYDQNVP